MFFQTKKPAAITRGRLISLAVIYNFIDNRTDSIKKMEKAGDLGKDQALDGIDALQKMTDEHIKLVDERVGKKEKEVATL